jgi:hypothetical protein
MMCPCLHFFAQLNSEIAGGCRSGKQCRTRWLNHLDPAIKKDPWTEAEEQVAFDGAVFLRATAKPFTHARPPSLSLCIYI